MASALVLVVEDEPKLATLLSEYLAQAGHRSMVLLDGSGAVAAVRDESPDAVVLDVMLPKSDGLTICRAVRSFSTVPIIMTTALVGEIDRLIGLDLGADDYVCKPYSPREVVARVNAQLRRAGWSGIDRDSIDPPALALDDAALRATVAGQALHLTPIEFRLLQALASQPGRVFTRDQVLARIHEDGRAITDRAVDSHVRNLRRKVMAATGGADPIRSVYGVGYAFEWSRSAG